ncbi:DUF6234 family protein [Actinospica sp.]|jgi:hypothetical protein|uniref:DUF6234 family protein n=1 Tax=Actinospica sp. TaxID=1872142 RepID=UPI002CB9F713|nr:DUF6234 family protein [Actinospica sp.]HWG24470.1 DUF6234 family protein [Actinospica sp.]
MEDDIQDAVPELLPARPPVPFTYSEPRPRPRRGVVTALAVAADLLVVLLGGFITFLISFQDFAENSDVLARKQASQTELLGGVAIAVLVIVAACAFWARAYVAGVLQVAVVAAVLVFTTVAVHHYARLFPYDGTPNTQPTSTSTYVPCFSGSNDCN